MPDSTPQPSSPPDSPPPPATTTKAKRKSKPTRKPTAPHGHPGPPIRCSKSALVATSKLKPHPRNPNKHGPEQLKLYAKILRHQGWRKPIVVSKLSGFIVACHGAWLTSRAEGWPKVPVDYQDFANEADELAHMVADNHLPQMAEMDEAELRALTAELAASSLDLGLLGFTDQELAALNATLKLVIDSDPKLDKLAELQSKWKTARGQLWALGPHRLLCGDALDPESWKRLGGPFNLCFADPPYELTVNVATFRSAAKRDLLLMATDKLFLQQSATGFRTFFCYTFDTAGSAMWTTTPLRKHTLIGWWRWIEHKTNFKGLDSVIHHDGGNQEAGRNHGEAKPLILPATFLPYFTAEHEAFADAFAGSGSTLMAAHSLTRDARSVELSPEYCAVILQRYQDATGAKPTLLEG